METEIIQETEEVVEVKETKKVKKGISGSTLKIIAIVAMLIDHIAAVIIDDFLMPKLSAGFASDREVLEFFDKYGRLYYTDITMRAIGRFGFPIFAFLLVEGFTHTHNIKKYIKNLAIFVLISELPFDLATSSKLFNFGYQSVFFTLLIGVLVMTGIKYLGEDKKWSPKLAPLYLLASLAFGSTVGYLLLNSEFNGFLLGLGINLPSYYFMAVCAVIMLVIMVINGRDFDADKKNCFTVSVIVISLGVYLAELLKTDYSGWGIFTIAVMYYFRNSYKKRMGFGVLALSFMSLLEATAFLMMIPAAKYNGKRGLNLKYFFYAFYPVHLLILYFIALALGFTTFAIR